MNFKEFTEKVKADIRNYLPAEYAEAKVEIRETRKNNNTTLTGVIITKPGQKIVPTVYLDYYFDNDIPVEEALPEIARIRVRHDETLKLTVTDLLDFKQVRGKVFYKLVNRGKNKDLLDAAPFKAVSEDLAALYIVEVTTDAMGGYGSITIDNKIMEAYGVTQEELDRTAEENEAGRGYRIISMLQLAKENDFIPADLQDEIDQCSEEEFYPMYVLTNRAGCFGASSILNQQAIAAAERKVGKDFFVIPSSIHEGATRFAA